MPRKGKDDEGSTVDSFEDDGKRDYSGLDLEETLTFLGVDPGALFSSDTDMCENDVGEKTLDRLVEDVFDLTIAEGVVDLQGEATRHDFVLMVIYKIVADYRGMKVRLKRGYNVIGDDVKGNVDFVVMSGKRFVMIVEVKQYDWIQGRAQNLMQLYNAYLLNVKQEFATDHTVYGVVTTGDTWEFIWCSGPKEGEMKTLDRAGKEFSDEVRGKLKWEHKAKFDPIEMNIRKELSQWKKRLEPLAKGLSFMISSSLGNSV